MTRAASPPLCSGRARSGWGFPACSTSERPYRCPREPVCTPDVTQLLDGTIPSGEVKMHFGGLRGSGEQHSRSADSADSADVQSDQCPRHMVDEQGSGVIDIGHRDELMLRSADRHSGHDLQPLRIVIGPQYMGRAGIDADLENLGSYADHGTEPAGAAAPTGMTRRPHMGTTHVPKSRVSVHPSGLGRSSAKHRHWPSPQPGYRIDVGGVAGFSAWARCHVTTSDSSTRAARRCPESGDHQCPRERPISSAAMCSASPS